MIIKNNLLPFILCVAAISVLVLIGPLGCSGIDPDNTGERPWGESERRAGFGFGNPRD